MRKIILGMLFLFLLVSTSFAAEALYFNSRGIEVADTDTPATILYEAINVDTGTGAVTFSEEYTFPVADGTATYVLATDGSGVVDWAAPTSATFTGGAISSDITLANGVDIKSSTTTAEAATIQVYDLTAAASYTNVLSWTNGTIPDIVLGAATNTLAIVSTGLNVTAAGAVTGVTDLTVAGAVTGVTDLTASGTLTAGDWSIGTFTTTGVTTLGNNTAALSIASTGIDISSAGAISNVTTLGMSGDLTNSGGDFIASNGKGLKGSVTNGETVSVFGYDVGTGYVSALTITNNATPATVLGNTSGTTAISSSDWTISTAGNMAGIGTMAVDGVITSTNATDASALGTASVVLAGGVGITKELWLGDDIDMSTSGTGTYELTLKTNMADALSIKDSAADIIVFATTSGSPLVTITPATTISGLLTAAGGIDTVGATNDITLKNDATIVNTSADLLTITEPTITLVGSTAITATTGTLNVQPAADGDAVINLKSDASAHLTITQTNGAGVTFLSTSDGTAGFLFDGGMVTLDGAAILDNTTSADVLTITETTVDVVGAFTANSVASDAAVSGTTITASTGFALGTGDYIGITSNEVITFVDTGGITASGINTFTIGGTAADQVTPDLLIIGDADSDGTTTSETLTVALTAASDPTTATWGFTSTQSAGYTFDKLVAMNGGATLGDAIGDITTFTGKIAGATPMSFDGATANTVYTILAVDDPTSASKTVTLPAVTGTVMLTGAATAITAGATPTITVTKGNQLFTDTITTDNQDQTLTFSGGGAAGDRVTIIFITDTGGSADEVITFQTTLVNSTGTLTLDNLEAGRYVIEFVSDGTVWNEVSRTGAQS